MNDRKEQQVQQEEQAGQRPLEKNETLQDAGASVPAYGRSSTGDQGSEQAGAGDEAIPLDNDETIGNP